MAARGTLSHPLAIIAFMEHEQTEQLSLIERSHLPVQFRLDRRTRQRGLAHVAELRRLLAERSSGATQQSDTRAA